MSSAKIRIVEPMEETPLVARGRFEQTFQGLGLFAASVVFLYGTYLLMKAMTEPLAASEMTVLGAGFMLALAGFGIAYLLWPRDRATFDRGEDSPADQDSMNGPVLTVYGNTIQDPVDGKRLLPREKSTWPHEREEWSATRQSREVALLQDDGVVAFVPGDNERQG
jgi:hypothetical protein